MAQYLDEAGLYLLWEKIKKYYSDHGIPIVNQEMINNLGLKPETDRYISIPDISEDLYGQVDQKVYKTSVNGNYVDILFKAIRELQSEVAKLRNSFKFGIQSYTGTTTAMSVVMDQYSELPEEEPLWAIEEDGLSDLGIDELNENTTIQGDVKVVIDEKTNSTFLRLGESSTWESTDSIISATDSKLFFYLTQIGKDVKLDLSVYNKSGTKLTDYDKILDLESIKLEKVPKSNFYNILVVISRSQQLEEGDSYYGKNFIWISIGDPESDTTLKEGYVDFKSPTTLISSPNYFSDEERYSFSGITWDSDTSVSKFKFYSKWQDFSNSIIASKPDDESYKYKVAHLTIRAVDSQEELASIKDQLLNNELIWNTNTNRLWIKSNNKLVTIGSSSSSSGDDNNNTGMTKEEMITALKEMGIIQLDNGNISLNSIEDITFIHTGTGSVYSFQVDSEGNLRGTEISKTGLKTFEETISNNSNIVLDTDVRGFIGQVRFEGSSGYSKDRKGTDAGLYSDRLKIGALYAPFKGDVVHGCTHSFIELENTADVDFPLTGCYLHVTKPNSDGVQEIYHLPLTGIIPAGGTYLVRGARHAEDDDVNAFIKVSTYDQEWYENGELLSLEVNNSGGYGVVLTYGNSFDGSELTPTTQLVRSSQSSDVISGISSMNTSTYPLVIIQPYFIDGVYYSGMVTTGAVGCWATSSLNMSSNTMYRNMFELDPAKQAFQAFNTKDSSRARWANKNDIMILDLSNEYISFPHTDDIMPISVFTPKASFEHKNVCTGKTGPDKDKPNMVTCSFGIDMYKTRCFNWISSGYFDEYIWFKESSKTDWEGKYQSYIPTYKINVSSVSEISNTSGVLTGYKVVFTVSNAGFSIGTDLSNFTILTNGDTQTSILTGISPTYSDNEYSFTTGTSLNGVSSGGTYILHRTGDDVKSLTSHKKFFDSELNNAGYSRITGRFPGNNTFFTSHKCVLNIVTENVSTPTEYTYVVGRADKDGNPDPNHSSEEMHFTLYPTSYKTRIYQTTDQQGFHWIEYQVWAAAAKALNEKIKIDQKASNIIPIVINTGDMTQNGTRINEWMDYYEGGKVLFNHLEQMNVVGNNDLCNTDPEILGTGDDNGKSNSYYFHLFYCYEIDESIQYNALIPNLSDSSKPKKFVPSFYYFDSENNRFIMMNSEITEINCEKWFGATTGTSTVNIYTGYTISSGNYVADDFSEFKTIYTMVYEIMNTAGKKSIITACHEMPFTVITSDSLLNAYAKTSRSISNSGALVGSHLNQISNNESDSTNNSAKGTYWFSRLLEYFNVKLCLGGHKHTYACTYPVRENYYYTDDSGKTVKTGATNKMTMTSTLKDDTANFIYKDTSTNTIKNLSKYPLINKDLGTRNDDIGFYPYEYCSGLTGGVVYFMCQATGYKLTSNKELPSPDQKFSWIIPKTTSKLNGSTFKDTASKEQKYPMFGIIDCNGTSYSIKLSRITNIMVNGSFNQKTYSTKNMGFQWLIPGSSDNFGSWTDTETTLLTL